MTLAELLAKADLKDDLEFEVGGEKFKIGDVRGFRSGVDAEKAAALAAKQQAEKVAREAMEALTALDTAMKEVQKNTAPPEKKKADWKSNPLFEEFVPVYDELVGQLKSAVETVNSTKKQLDESRAVYSYERMRRQWAEAPLKPKDKTFEQVVQEIVKTREVDDLGMPTLEKYLHRETEELRTEEKIQAALKKNNQEWEQKFKMGQVGAHGANVGGTKFSTRKAKEPPIKKLDELTSEVLANDPDIAAAMNGETIQ